MAELYLPKLSKPNPEHNEGKWSWIHHKLEKCKCDIAWFAGPFANDEKAGAFALKISSTSTCPGYDVDVEPNGNDYNIGQM